MPDQRTVADNIRAWMAIRRVTQVQMASALGVGQSTISDRLTSDTWPAADLPRVAQVLQIDVAELFERVFPGSQAGAA